MKKYEVTFYYHTNCTVTVEAENEKEALRKAECEVTDDKCIQEILWGLQEDDSPDVEEVTE